MKRRSDCKLIDINNKRIYVCESEQTRSDEDNKQEPIETLLSAAR